jgi:methylenetetrahydrofolate dehydrogenase (NADP+)/methenyltetrahydrofolate cyclohydrolase
MEILDGRKLSNEILTKIKKEVAFLSFVPIFCDVLVGEDSSSLQYVKMKARTAEAVGIKFQNANFPASITMAELIKKINVLNKIPNMCGIIIQLPLPEHIDRQIVLDAIDPELDVDCLGAVASEKFYSGLTTGGFPTALACVAVLETLNLDLNKKNIVVLGQGLLVGKPVTALLKSKGFSPVVVGSDTENKEKIIKQADVIISGMGKGKYIKGEMIKKGAILIDAGTSESLEHSSTGELNSGIIGDVDLKSVKDIAGYVSPVPGGVGPVTVAMLLNNVLTVAQTKI